MVAEDGLEHWPISTTERSLAQGEDDGITWQAEMSLCLFLYPQAGILRCSTWTSAALACDRLADVIGWLVWASY
jgi:hypothetical protein